MELPTEIFGNVIVIHAPDELNEDHSERFERFVTIQELAQVIVDLDDAESFDSFGLEMLLDVQESLRARSGDLKIVTSNNVNRKILEITRLDEHIEVFDSVIDAVKSFV